ncbi:UDP-glucose 4-epimerase GalE [bacterium]|jgi:UDP-glucose 4-epimerase|nr:UDP-glucose 4-epimerase GalE [bacterium]
MSQGKTLVVGGAGYIGSHVSKWLRQKGHDVLVADNFSTGHRFLVSGPFVELDLTDAAAVDQVFATNQIKSVVHLAAKSLVGESMSNPALYYQQNVGGVLNLLNSMVKANVKELVFSSTCAVYSDKEEVPFTEKTKLDPESCYGKTKLACEYMIQDFSKAYNLDTVIFRYFNVAGADPDLEVGECHIPESHLIPRFMLALLDVMDPIKIFGDDYDTPDGTCIRDYIHVNDIAYAHELALAKIDNLNNPTFNLGTGAGYSVKEIISKVESVTGISATMETVARRPGDANALVCDGAHAKSVLGFEAQCSDLDTIIKDAWRWHKEKEPSLVSLRNGNH